MSHIHELFDFTVSAIILNKGRVLLMHHTRLNKWMQPGGHIELNEDPEEALWREVQEETGLTKKNLTILQTIDERPKNYGSKPLPIPFDFNVHKYGDKGHKHIDLMYIIISDSDTVKENPDESSGLRWFTQNDLDDVKKDMFPDIYDRARFALKNHNKSD